MTEFTTQMTSPLGPITIKASDRGVKWVWFDEEKVEENSNLWTIACKKQLQEYFEGVRKVFDLPLDPGGTTFQNEVWRKLGEVAYGQTWTYHQLAVALGDQKAIRAVAGANAKNPISIIVPCHRIVGADLKLTGYAGGLERKKWLLQHEGSWPKDLFS